ncbi:hypothetical protein C2E20_6138 [Micractinium conductrix]|uniref:Uncharacterized protein n=1 Tax=Micractinium conductrix TaxID=554055 RepID=A0A2P6V8D7_9CHLO|nr:hypothetical protein C2E20_6138 [Micractinium conductrix]|eukprot:PSC70343.1 hypothetical protein C2E20_6138 [Micractinium conductrix]
MRVLQQAGDRMPYKAENWETVLGVVNEARITLEGSGLSCGANAAAVERHVTARLAACRIQEAADDVPAAAPPVAAPAPAAAGTRSQATPGGAAMLQQAASARPSAGAGTGGRSRRRAAVAAQAAIVAAVEGGGGGEDDEEAPGTAGGRRQAGVAAQQQQQLPGSSDQENYAAFNAGPRGPASKPTAKQISSMAAPPAAALGQKQALQPSAGQQSAGTAKRARQ